MVKVRQDAWSHEDDLLLAETVLRHIREGSTQLNAFEEVGDKLNRTSAACGFRWNAEVRAKYENAIDLAKRQRKERKRAMAKEQQPVKKEVVAQTSQQLTDTDINWNQSMNTESSLTLDRVIQFLTDMKKDYQASNQSKQTLEETQKENEQLREKVSELEKKLADTEDQLNTIQEDYQVFMQIMDRARKMTVLEDQGSLKTPAFRMDKNGNLQQVAEGSNH
ncbi:RsfA family transcriptional regulator [Oceanobacillus halotolerans]|uniref:RsfA family transcriptional regulator n=1 Tax=Oceanobacillus halotolerans TaxID=2663380 RepID=UPI0013D9BFC3|nr:RsfA family transcriptional regulator [Oceanobacillus halotolerans]